MTDLKNQTAIITGAGKGIGRSIAEALAAEGVHLGLIARTASDLESLRSELSDKYKVNVFVHAADVSVRADIEAAVQNLQEQLGAIDILINNAGIGSFGKMIDMDPEEWERIIRINLMGAYYTTRAALPFMIEQNSGNILNVASTAGERGFATGSAYCASKAGLIAMSEAVMQEVRKSNIRVVTLNPSTVNTELATSNNLPIGDDDRMMQPEDVADLAVATLKLPARMFVKTAALWTTNPQ
ncbi:3-ketoacyl-ACP reductase [Saccharibacillus sp. JS10]|uniref:3-ketoacyl-ACP reductase n=1 Tax=Saccharibacillus sp. JS10 TaxID=2950552 RepID=UPI00210D3BB9|nr:3-ketoacyl-ACP reductase [Saccharibacillus sp. JS10]MCQ4088057.1 3-ketoacyl-ACP reductase [Saccharibacillus sp. JS10]